MSDIINKENKAIWNTNANFWDAKMGTAGNDWHQELIAPKTERLLDLKAPARLLDVGCGNGVFARRMAAKGIAVTAFDFAEQNIENAKKYPSEGIEYLVLDATNEAALRSLGSESFEAAVANMVLMDVPEIEPLFKALQHLLVPNGCFVFSVCHPCFHSEQVEHTQGGILVRTYHQPQTSKGVAINKQPELQYYFHRSVTDYLRLAFQYGFVVDGYEEPVFEEAHGGIFTKVPPALIVRVRKL